MKLSTEDNVDSGGWLTFKERKATDVRRLGPRRRVGGVPGPPAGAIAATVVGVFTVVDMRDVATSVTPAAATLPIESVATYLQVLAAATEFGVLDPTVHQLAVDALVNHWSDDDPRWSLLERHPATASQAG